MPFDSRRADLLERSLQGQESTDPKVRSLVETVGRIPALTSRACAPRDEFVRALGITLRAEALTLAPRKVPGRSATGARRSPAKPLVFVIGGGLPRILAGATASLLLVGAVVGGASRSALPGGLLYPVRQLLDSAAVQLAGSDFERGKTLLSQAQEHISDAGALVEADGAKTDPASVDQALLSAKEAVSASQRELFGEFERNGNPQALVVVQDFVARALPQVFALRQQVPAESKPDVDALIVLLQGSQSDVARKVGECGQPCALIDGAAGAGSSGSTPTGLPSTLTAGTLPLLGSTAATTAPGGVVVGPSVFPLLISTGGTKTGALPPATVGPTTVSPPPIVIPPLPLLTSTPTLTPALPGPP